MKMKHEEAKGKIQWVDEECVGFQCECGEKIVISEYPNEVDDNVCPRCDRDYVLVPMYNVYEKEY